MSLPSCLSDKNLVKFQISACPSLQRLLDAVQLGARRGAAAVALWLLPFRPAPSRVLGPTATRHPNLLHPPNPTPSRQRQPSCDLRGLVP